MQIDEFIKQFKEFCIKKYGNKSGTANSYANSVKYLINYLDFCVVDEKTILAIKSIEPDVRDKTRVFYDDLLNTFALCGRKSYIEKGHLNAAILTLYEFLHMKLPQLLVENENNILINTIKDNEINEPFKNENLRRILPISRPNAHIYEVSRINGTVKSAVNKICSGRKAEKYFISYLKDYLGLNQGIDYIDVSNNKEYGFDIRVFQCGIEVKNIKNGGFYLTDNEIARLEHSETHLILVDIDNGIWMLKNDSNWLKTILTNIKSIRNFCSDNYKMLDLTDIRINLDETVEREVVEISNFNKEKFKVLLQF